MEQLHEMERKLTMLRIMELLDKPVRGAFDLRHLQASHAYIFQDVYDWAGEFRKFDITKGGTMKSVTAVIPDTKALAEFNAFCISVFAQQQLLEEQNRSLIALRDSMLPELIAGKIDVSTVQA